MILACIVLPRPQTPVWGRLAGSSVSRLLGRRQSFENRVPEQEFGNQVESGLAIAHASGSDEAASSDEHVEPFRR